MNILDRIPPKARAWIYGVLGTLYTVEATLDAFDYGVVPERPQGAAVAVLSALGFGIAFRNTDRAAKPSSGSWS